MSKNQVSLFGRVRSWMHGMFGGWIRNRENASPDEHLRFEEPAGILDVHSHLHRSRRRIERRRDERDLASERLARERFRRELDFLSVPEPREVRFVRIEKDP